MTIRKWGPKFGFIALILGWLWSVGLLFAAPPVPANDGFANAVDLGSAALPVLEGTTLGATPGPKEPISANNVPPNEFPSVWFKWTAPSGGMISFLGEAGYPNVWVYNSIAGSPNEQMAVNSASFAAEPGVTYFFAVATTAFTGQFRVRLVSGVTPPNDAFANAVELNLAGASVEVTGSGLGATLEPNEPNPLNAALGSIWYKWKPPVTGRLGYAIALDAPWHLLQVFRRDGPTLQDLAAVEPYVIAGNTYYIAVYGQDAVHFWIRVATEAPPNDDRQAAIPLEMMNDSASADGTTFDATPDPGDFYTFGMATVWYQWTADRTGTIIATLAPAESGVWGNNPHCRVFRTHTNPEDLAPLGSDGQTVGVNAGETYFFQVYGGSAACVPFRLTVNRVSTPPNDNFANAAPLGSLIGFSTVGSTLEPDEPRPPGAMGSIWYRFSPMSVSRLVGAPSDPNTAWRLYSGSSLSSLQELDSPDLIPGVTYYLSFTRMSAEGSTFDFNGTFVPVSGNTNDFFVNATIVTGFSNLLQASSAESGTREPGEPGNSPGSLWWRYTTPAKGWLMMAPKTAMWCVLYDGSTLDTLKPLNSGFSVTAVEAGQTCYIQAEHGDVRLIFSEAAENDNFNNAIDLGDAPTEGFPPTFYGHTGGAGIESGEPVLAGGTVATIWYRWTAPFDGRIGFSFYSSAPSAFGIYVGDALAGLQPVPSDTGPVPVQRGKTYYFQLGAGTTAPTLFGLSVGAGSYEARNDNLADALDLFPFGASVDGFGYLNSATAEAGEPSHLSEPFKSIWWKYRAPAGGMSLRFSARRADGGLLGVAVYRGGPGFENLTLAAKAEGTGSFLLDTVDVAEQEEIFIAVAAPPDANGLSFVDAMAPGPMMSGQAIHLQTALLTQQFGVRPITLNAYADSNLPVIYTVVRGPAIVSGSTLSILGAGIVSLKISQPGNDSYLPAPDLFQTFGVRKRAQTINFNQIDISANPMTLSATSSAGLPVQFEIASGPASIQNNTLVVTGPGPITVRATQSGDANVEAAEPVTQTCVARRLPQAVTLEIGPVSLVGAGAAVKPLSGLSASGSLTRRAEVLAVADSGLPVTLSVGSGNASFSGTSLTITGSGEVTIVATQPGNSLYLAATAEKTIPAVQRVNQVINFAALADATMATGVVPLQAEASSGLPVIFTLIGGNASISGATLNIGGAGLITVRASQPGNDQFAPAADVDRSFQVTALPQTISWPPLPKIFVGNTPLGLVAAASSGLPVSFQLLSGPGELIGNALRATGPGVIVVRAVQAGNNVYQTAAADVSITADLKKGQTIRFDPIADVPVTTPSISLAAAASSGLPVTFAVIEGNASLSGNLLMINGAGQITIRAVQPGDDVYEAALPVDRSFAVTRLAQTITVGDLPPIRLGEPAVKLVASASSGLPVAVQLVSGPGRLSGGLLEATGEGVIILRFTQDGNSVYQPTSSDRQVNVAVKLAQSIQFSPLPDVPVGTKSVDLIASASSGLPVSFTLIAGGATLNGAHLALSGAGRITVRASQAGNQEYEAAAGVERSFQVTRLAQTIAAPTWPALHFGDGPVILLATASSGLPVNLEVLSGPAQWTGSRLTITGAGVLTIRLSQSGSETYLPATDLTTNLAIAKATQAILFPAPGTPLLYDKRVQLAAQASSGLPVTLRVLSGPGELNDDNVLYANNYGEIIVEAAQAGDGNYEPATATQIIRVVEPPKLSGVLTGGKLVIQWPTESPGFQLESALRLDGSWTPVAMPGASNTIEIPTEAGSRFFRLRSIE